MKTKLKSYRGLVWRKAAVLGSIWAASEIVLGSFLHNAQVPLKGEILTAIGIAIMIAGHRLWPERGLLWRTGLICAAMKSVSPSAAIFGPMIAIFMEGLLAEAGVRLLGGNSAGYLLAGGLAMCWAIGHKLGNLLIFYGSDAIAVYLRGVEWLQARFFLAAGSLWSPVLLLFAAYFLAGAAAAIAGMRAGREKASAFPSSAPKSARKSNPSGENIVGSYSLAALILHGAFAAGVMVAGRKIPYLALAAGAGVYAYFCARAYSRARSLLRQTGVWAGVLLASIAAGFILGSVEAGIYMAIRAFTLTLAFAAIGCELLNPAIRKFIERFGGGVLFETLEYAFSALPGIIAELPSGKEFARRPLAALGGAVARAPFLLDAITPPPVFIITGKHGGGKSTLVMELAERLRAAGQKPGGICAAGLWADGLRSGFDILDLASEKRVPLCRRNLSDVKVKAGEFGFYQEGLSAGDTALSSVALEGADVVFIDEVGFMELDGGGWASALERLLQDTKRPLVLVVRDYLLDKVRERWGLSRAVVWRAGSISAGAAVAEMKGAFR